MAKTLLNSVNAVLKRVGLITGDAAALTSLTDSPRQRAVDVAVQVINEGIDDLYSASHTPFPIEQAESTITLVTSTQSYTLATDLVQMRWPLIDKTNSRYIWEYPGGYNGILLMDPEQDDTGMPVYGAIDPTTLQTLYLDRSPTSSENGNVYTYQYDRDMELTITTSTVPFNNVVYRAMIPVWVQLWKREMRNEFDAGLYQQGVGRAAGYLTESQPRDHYGAR